MSQKGIATNGAHGLKVIGPRGEGSKKMEPPAKDDMRAVIDVADESLRLTLLFAASTGARAGEQWAVRWGDVDFAKHELHINRRVDVYGEECAPKRVAGVKRRPSSTPPVAVLLDEVHKKKVSEKS